MTESTARSLAELCRYPGPSGSEADHIVKLVRSGKRSMALKKIGESFYNCTAEEAETLYDAYVNCVVGKPSKLVEISISDVEFAQSTENFFHIPQQYVARRAAYVGSLCRLSERSYILDGRNVTLAEIDQVWKMVPLADDVSEASKAGIADD